MSETAETAPPATAEATADAETDATCEYDHLDDLDLPPLRIHVHATRNVRDRSSGSNLQIPQGIQNQISQKRYSLDSKVAHISPSPTGVGSVTSSIASRRGRSRSRSPSMRSGKERTIEGNSSFSSLEEFVDPDILYDKLGFSELDAKKQQHSHHNSWTSGEFASSNNRPVNLTPVSERMSEDTMEDVHAFSDLSANTNTRPSSSVGTGGSTVCGEVSSHVLDPLYEGDEDLESDDDSDKLGELEHAAQVILTNLENITLQEHANKTPSASKTGADSPSLPNTSTA